SQIAVFAEAELSQLIEHGRISGAHITAHAGILRIGTKDPDAHLSIRLLCSRRDRPCKRRCRRAAEQHDELTPIHSMTSSASNRNDSGITRPSAFAVLRLTRKAKLVGCTIGRLAGFSPRRIRAI